MLRLQAERLADIVLTAPERRRGRPRAQSADMPRIEVRDLASATPTPSPTCCDGVNLRIEPGESVAIVGPSGCGKTTLLKLMLGIHAPHAGEILVGGVRCAQLGLRAWRDMIGTVMQDDPLFAGLDRRQHLLLRPAARHGLDRECARLAAVHDEIAAMPMGYHTLIGDMGASLSGGQKQRILLARALYKRPRILFLDEATSALDVDSERAGERGHPPAEAHARHRRPPARDDRLGRSRDRPAARCRAQPAAVRGRRAAPAEGCWR